jgi:hypothetical protein
MGPSLVGSARVNGNKEAVTRIVLHGLMGELDGQTYAGLMLPMKANDDQWVAEVLTYIRTAFGNSGSAITKDDVARIRAATKDRAAPYTMADLAAFVPASKAVMAGWTITASHNGKKVAQACDGDPTTRWDTGTKQEAGQWFQIDFGKPWALTQITAETNASPGDWPRGWELTVSDDGMTWSKPIAKGENQKVPVIDVKLPANTVARYMRLTQTVSGKSGGFWSIHELQVFGEVKK